MSEKSTSRWWVRGLLWLHFVVVAASITAIWPSSVPEVRSAIPLVALLCLIAIWSSRVAVGSPMGRTGWVLHVIWTVVLTWSMVQCWGPFCFQPQPMPGDLSGFGRSDQFAIGVRLILLLLTYSGIPIGLGLLAKNLVGGPSAKVRPSRTSSLLLFGAALLSTVALRLTWRGTDAGASWIGGGLWAVSFAVAAYLSARGDPMSVRILLCGAALLGLVKRV